MISMLHFVVMLASCTYNERELLRTDEQRLQWSNSPHFYFNTPLSLVSLLENIRPKSWNKNRYDTIKYSLIQKFSSFISISTYFIHGRLYDLREKYITSFGNICSCIGFSLFFCPTAWHWEISFFNPAVSKNVR